MSAGLPTACSAFRESAFDALDGGGAPRAVEDAHASQCAECGAWWTRQLRLASALRALPRASAPAELDERVQPEQMTISAIERGARRLEPLRAPAILDQLVREEIADPAAARTRRFAGDLHRLTPPRALDAIANASLARQRGRRASLRALMNLRVLAAAGFAGLLLTAWALRSQPARAHYRFEVVQVDDLASLRSQAPLVFDLMDGLSGGTLRSGSQGGEPR